VNREHQPESTEPCYHIGAAASMAAVHPQTLRMYERLGLVVPSRSRGNTRLYSTRDVERIQAIVRLTREEGVNLAGVVRIFELEDRVRELERQVIAWMQQWQQRIQRELAKRAGAHRRSTGDLKAPVKIPISRGRGRV